MSKLLNEHLIKKKMKFSIKNCIFVYQHLITAIINKSYKKTHALLQRRFSYVDDFRTEK